MKLVKFDTSKKYPNMLELVLTYPTTTEVVVNDITGVNEFSLPTAYITGLLNINLNNYSEQQVASFRAKLAYVIQNKIDVNVEVVYLENLKLNVITNIEFKFPKKADKSAKKTTKKSTKKSVKTATAPLTDLIG